MENLQSYLAEVDAAIVAKAKTNKESFGANIQINGSEFPDLKLAKLVFFGIDADADLVRASLYPLMWKFEGTQVADLGNIIPPKNETERKYIIEEIISELAKKDMVAIIIGQSETDILGVYNGLATLKEALELVHLTPEPEMHEASATKQILIQEPNYLFNIEFMASQTYLISPSSEKLIEDLYLGRFPLGFLRKNINETEPIFRSASIVHFDLKSIKASELPHCEGLLPNGLFNHEAAILCRYAGISNKSRCILFSNTHLATSGADGRQQLAQMLWYFVEGFSSRFNDEPEVNHSDFIIYRNHLPSSKHELVFYKSRKSNRWWMEIPHPYEKKSYFVACNYKDYEMVLADDMPDRWWKAFQRLM